MIQFLEDRSEADKEKPFFGYLTYTAPHWPLQAPRRVIDK
jgi:arylsulfatase A-like enzyme